MEEASVNFDDYLKSVLGMAQGDLAQQKSVRMDGWESKRVGEREFRVQDNKRAAKVYRWRPPMKAYLSDSRDSSSNSSEQSNTDSKQSSDHDSLSGQSDSERGGEKV